MCVFAFFEARDLHNFLCCNKHFHRIASDDFLWRSLLTAELGAEHLPGSDPGSGGWRRRFWQWHRFESCLCSPKRQPKPSPTVRASHIHLHACRPGLRTTLTHTVASPLPQPRFLHRAACGASDSGRWLYVFGGRGEASEYNDLWVLDKQHAGGDSLLCGSPASPSSSSSAAAGVPSSSSSAAASAAAASRAKPKSAWRNITAANAPSQRQSPTLTAVGHRLLMFGGRQGDVTFLNDTWVFDTISVTWTCVRESDDVPPPPFLGAPAHPPLTSPVRPSPRWAHSAVAFGESVLIFGGSAPGTCFNDLHWFDLAGYKPGATGPRGATLGSTVVASAAGESAPLTWRRQLIVSGPTPPARSGHCACALGEERMFLFGGNTTEMSFSDLWEYNVLRSMWVLIKAAAGIPPSPRVGHTLTALGSRLLVVGGREYSTNHFDPSLHSFNVTSKQWAAVPLQTSANITAPVRTGHCATVHAGKLLLFGGLNNQNRLLDDLFSVSLIS